MLSFSAPSCWIFKQLGVLQASGYYKYWHYFSPLTMNCSGHFQCLGCDVLSSTMERAGLTKLISQQSLNIDLSMGKEHCLKVKESYWDISPHQPWISTFLFLSKYHMPSLWNRHTRCPIKLVVFWCPFAWDRRCFGTLSNLTRSQGTALLWYETTCKKK